MYYNTKKKLKPGLVALYDIQPGNVCLRKKNIAVAPKTTCYEIN